MKHIISALLAVMLGILSFPAVASTLTREQVSEALATPGTESAMAAAVEKFDANDIEGVNADLDKMPVLVREATLASLARRSADLHFMTPERETFLVKLSHQQPTYLIEQQGAGYSVTVPAFNFSGTARWVLNHWQGKLLQEEFLRILTYRQLDLSQWLSFLGKDYTLRRNALVELIPKLDSEQLSQLEILYKSDADIVWIPDNAVLAALSLRTGDKELFNTLWLRRSDKYSLSALQTLAMLQGDQGNKDQLMAAAINPSLRMTAYRHLAAQTPLSADVKAFLADKIDDRHDGQEVAGIVARQGKTGWLESLLEESSRVSRRNIEPVLEARQTPGG